VEQHERFSWRLSTFYQTVEIGQIAPVRHDMEARSNRFAVAIREVTPVGVGDEQDCIGACDDRAL
jgi:hypothetical protein